MLQHNLGFPEEQIKAYYEAHKREFRRLQGFDANGKACTSNVVLPYDEVALDVSKKMFLEKYQPDSAGVKEVKRALANDKQSPLVMAKTAADSTRVIRSERVEYLRDLGHRDFFLDLYYKEKFGKPFPRTLSDIYGKDKYVTPAEMDVVFSWMAADKRATFRKDPQVMLDFALWIARWKLFSDKSKQTGFASRPKTQNLLKWAWELEIAQRYVDNTLVPAAVKKAAGIDSSMALYSCSDKEGRVVLPSEKLVFSRCYNTLVTQAVSAKLDSLVYEIRKGRSIKFFKQADGYFDRRVKNPAELFRQANALRDSGKAREALEQYQTLVDNFVFTPEGKQSLTEMAKIQGEQGGYTEGITNYRSYLLSGVDRKTLINTMFMIGYMYDQNLSRPDLAELNYKWVLKNAPESELGDDAEFMMLHLGEPMAGPEELQAAALRQGKKVEVSPN